MVRVFMVRGKYEIGQGEPLIRMTDGVSPVCSPCRQNLDECKEDNIYKNPHNTRLNRLFVFDQSVHLSDSELISPIVRNSMNGEIR
jgi:hypothetical protein